MVFCFRDTSDGSWEEITGDVRNVLGVMRTGMFASGLMLTGEANVQLVLLTAEKPTITLLHNVVNTLADQLPVSVSFFLGSICLLARTVDCHIVCCGIISS